MEVTLEITVKELEAKLEKKNEVIRELNAKNIVLQEKVEKLNGELMYWKGLKVAYEQMVNLFMERVKIDD